jgi:aminopeptidase N
MRSRRVVVAVAVATCLVLASVAGTVVLVWTAGSPPGAAAGPTGTGTRVPVSARPGGSGVFAPGAEGLGDPYYPDAGNGGYDVSSYDLRVRYAPDTTVLTGDAVITATATTNLSRFDLDLHGLTVRTVTVDHAAAVATRHGDELVVTPAIGITAGTRFLVEVDYDGVPSPYHDPDLGDVGFLTSTGGAVAIGEPEVAASWFPVNDHPSDKATYAIAITVPDGVTALSNGVLTGTSSAGGWTTWSWRERSPMASYLATMVVGNYRVVNDTHNGTPVVLAVDASLGTDVDGQLARTPEIIDYLASVFGPYPFDAMGGIALADPRVRFALENQTRPIYSGSFFQGPGDHSWVVVHELAHQWYGDSVGVRDWKQVWLNEGFATYAEWLWSEHTGGPTAQQSFDQRYAQAGSSVWAVPPANPGKDNLFSPSVYVRGAMALQALRVTVGDTAFFAIMKSWAATKADSTATTDEFVALAERISGQRLDQLFATWLYGTTIPPRP